MTMNIPFLKTEKKNSTTEFPHTQTDPQGILRSGKLHPELTRRVERLLENAGGEGINLYVVEGYRSWERQAKLLESGRAVTNAKPGKSFHNYGLAVDIAFRDQKGNPSWDMKNDWQRLGQLGKETGLFWGGDWKTKFDGPHFQLIPNDQISRVRQLTNTVGLEAMWEKI